MTRQITLDDLRAAYKRTTSRIYRILEDGYDFGVDQLIVEALDRDALIVDAAFFVLIFGQIESRLNALAIRRVGTDRKRPAAMREAKFEKRLEHALPGPESADLRREIGGWYDTRSDAAHGGRLTYTYDVAAVFDRAFQFDELVTTQLNEPDNPGEG